MRLGLTMAAVAACLLAGCSAPPRWAQILVTTAPPGASCLLTRQGQPIAAADPTPAIARIDPGAADIAVTCRRSGFEETTVLLPPRPAAEYQRRLDIALAPKPPGVPR